MRITTYIPYPILKHGVLNILQQNPEHQIAQYLSENEDNSIVFDVIFLAFMEEKELSILGFLEKVVKKYPKVPIVLFCPTVSIAQVKKYFKAGVKGIILHSASENELIGAIQKTGEGELFLDAILSEKLKSIQIQPFAKTDHCSCLTNREKQVLNLIVEEYTTKEIAQELFVSDCTIETHRINLISKLGVKNTAGLVREACMNHIYQPVLMC